MHTVYLLLGSNKGNRFKNLLLAKYFIQLKAGNVLKNSAIYKTEAWGNTKQSAYLNQAILLETDISPFRLLKVLEKIEKTLGRANKSLNAARTIDIDILLYDNIVLESKNLIIPHPRLQLRNFTLLPLAELNKSYTHPVLHKSIEELCQVCEDTLKVSIFKPK